ncbi:MAG: phosphoribosylformylglycinamidine synthase subunit PurS [Chloroflexi bacterium]|nr:MAG: phosphoribosylformylglycinamidine synthase subunit PurS [Chloroflexota bacterium]
MTFRAEVFVTPKAVVNDPQGLTIRQGLRSLGFEGVQEVRAGKYLVLTLESPDRDTALARLDDMARTLLANAVIEDYRIEITAVRETVAP